MLRLINEQPDLTDSQIAKQVGVSSALVWKARRAAEHTEAQNVPDADLAGTELERLIGQRLPADRLVRALERLIANPKTPASVRLAAINAAIEQRGIVTRKQRKDAEADRRPGNVYIFAPTSVPLVQAHPVVVGAIGAQPVLTSAQPDVDKSTS